MVGFSFCLGCSLFCCVRVSFQGCQSKFGTIWRGKKKSNKQGPTPGSLPTSHSLPLQLLMPSRRACKDYHQEVVSPSETWSMWLSELARILSLGILRSVVLSLLLLVTGPSMALTQLPPHPGATLKQRATSAFPHITAAGSSVAMVPITKPRAC